tara:strand:- start:767 stop:1594 length:828 start_codon:yes stop_codon:yes gene_type:complete
MYISNAEYHSRSEYGSTALKPAAKGFGKGLLAIVNGASLPQTQALAEGSAVHSRLGEPQLFNTEFAIKPQGMSFVNKEGKAWKKEHSDKTILSAEFGEKLKHIELAFLDSPASRFYEQEGETEASYFWKIDGLSRGGKCRPDWISADKKTIIDLKTTTSADRKSFQRAIMNYSYHLSAAWYMHGVKQATGVTPEEFIWVAIEKDTPFGIGVYRADAELLEEGKAMYERALANIQSWEETGIYPDHTPEIESIGLPSCMKKKADVTPQNYQEIELY